LIGATDYDGIMDSDIDSTHGDEQPTAAAPQSDDSEQIEPAPASAVQMRIWHWLVIVAVSGVVFSWPERFGSLLIGLLSGYVTFLML
jgi:hypothetical protein